MTINVQNLVVILSLAATIIGMVSAMYKLFSRFEKVEKQVEHRKNDSEILLKSLLAIMDGLIEQGCDGNVKQTRKELVAYMAER